MLGKSHCSQDKILLRKGTLLFTQEAPSKVIPLERSFEEILNLTYLKRTFRGTLPQIKRHTLGDPNILATISGE